MVVMTGVDKLQEGTQGQRANGRSNRRQPAAGKSGGKQEVSPSRTFILRPVATSLLMVGILLAGAVAYKQLPVSALPEVDYPTIQVITFYPGASPDVMASSVTAPLERQFGQVPGLQQMTSTSSDGSSVITLQFNLSLNIDVAEQEVQQSINASGTYLPAGSARRRRSTAKTNPADTPILTLALTSKTDAALARWRIWPTPGWRRRSRNCPASGLVSISGGQKPAVRIQANPTALASYGLNLEDLRSAIVAANVNQAKGNFDGPHQAYQIGANDQLLSSADYRPLIVAYRNGAPVKLTDVADVIDDIENIRQAAWMNETPAVIVNIQRQPGANIISVVDRIKQLLPQLTATLPAVGPGEHPDRPHQHHPRLRRGRAVRADADRRAGGDGDLPVPAQPLGHHHSQRRRAALAGRHVRRDVPARLQPEQPHADGADHLDRLRGGRCHRDDREHRRATSKRARRRCRRRCKGAEQIGFTIISLTISLIAVLIPLLFMGDIVGRLFREFAVTLSVTILVSAVVSLTLTPMMCAKLLKHTPEATQGRFYRASERAFEAVIALYGKTLRFVLRCQTATLLVAVGTLALTVLSVLSRSPKGFFPIQDTGVIQGVSEAGADRLVSRDVAAPAAARQGDSDRIPAVESLSSFIGIDGTNTTLNSGRILINLKPLDERKISASDVIRRLQPELAKVAGITLFMQPVQDLTVEDRVSRTQFQYTLEDPNADELNTYAPQDAGAAAASCRELRDVATDQQVQGLRAQLVFDRDTASRLGITPATIDQTLYDAYGQREVSTIFTQLNQYHVVLEVKPAFQQNPADLRNLFIRTGAPASRRRRGPGRRRFVHRGSLARARQHELGRHRGGQRRQCRTAPAPRSAAAPSRPPRYFPTAARCRSARSPTWSRSPSPSPSTTRASSRWSRSPSIWRPTLRWAMP